MGHVIRALLLAPNDAQRAALRATGARMVALERLTLVPLEDDLIDRIAIAGRARPTDIGLPAAVEERGVLYALSPHLARFAAALSRHGPVAFVATEYFGGEGTQGAAVWDAEALLMPPKEDAIGPINEALRILGVRATETKDEFETVGLQRHRDTLDWFAEAEPP
jgi:hypothetical protein